MRITIIGAGAVGGYYGAKLCAAGADVTFLARGATLTALNARGIEVESFRGDFKTKARAVDSLEGLAPADLVIVTVKSYDTESLIPLIAPAVGPDTAIVSFQNGVENEMKLADAFGAEKVMGCVCYIGTEAVAPGVIRHTARGMVTLGEFGGKSSQRLEAIVATLRNAGIDAEPSDDIRKVMWGKLCWNTAFNQVCTVARASVGDVLESDALKRLLRNAMSEVIAISNKHGVTLDASLIDGHLSLSTAELKAVKPSMLQDFERGRRLEHESFSGFVVREGKRLGVLTPVNAVLYDLLSFLDGGRR